MDTQQQDFVKMAAQIYGQTSTGFCDSQADNDALTACLEAKQNEAAGIIAECDALQFTFDVFLDCDGVSSTCKDLLETTCDLVKENPQLFSEELKDCKISCGVNLVVIIVPIVVGVLVLSVAGILIYQHRKKQRMIMNGGMNNAAVAGGKV